MKVLIIIPYFGVTPLWIDYFTESCSRNESFNWLLYGNLDIPIILPENIRLIKARLTDFNKLASAKLGYKVDVSYPYKICDFRPAFGKIFEDYLIKYDFWGYCDLDIIFGRISNFIAPKQLYAFDIITSRPDYTAGHFTLYRNNDYINRLYTSVDRVKKHLQNAGVYYSLDERANLVGLLLTNSFIRINLFSRIMKQLKKTVLYRIYRAGLKRFDITQVIRKEESKRKLRILRLNAVKSDHFYTKQGIENWCADWNNGILIDLLTKRELLYFHFLKSKYSAHFKIRPKNGINRFIIDKHGIYCPDESLCL